MTKFFMRERNQEVDETLLEPEDNYHGDGASHYRPILQHWDVVNEFGNRVGVILDRELYEKLKELLKVKR